MHILHSLMKTVYHGMYCNMGSMYGNILWFSPIVTDRQTGKTLCFVEFLF